MSENVEKQFGLLMPVYANVKSYIGNHLLKQAKISILKNVMQNNYTTVSLLLIICL